MIKIKNILPFFIVLYSLSTFYFYAPVFLNLQVLKAFSWLLLVLVFGLSIKQFLIIKPANSRYFYDFRYIIFAMLFSIVPAFFSWNQPPLASIRALMPYLPFILFFFFLRFKPSIKLLENIIWILCLGYIACYFYALLKAPTLVFGQSDKVDTNRIITRLFIPGRSFVYLAYFLALSRYAKLKSTYWLSITMALFMIIVMHVIRQYILFSFLIGFFIIFKEVKWWKKIVVVSIIIFGASYLYAQLPFLQVLVELTEGQLNSVSSGAEDIRMTSFKYFFTEFPPNIFSFIFGNGVPHDESTYGIFYRNVINFKGMYMSDVGYAQMFGLFGAVGLILFIVVFYKAISHKNLPVELRYTKWFVIFVVLSNIMSGLALNISSIVCLTYVFYILEINYRENCESKKKLNNCNE